MWGYILKRVLWFIPTLILVTLLGFVLLVNAPGDPLDLLVNPLSAKSSGNANPEEQKNYWRKQLGLDLPVFYVSVKTLSEPDTLYKIYDQQTLKAYKDLLKQSGNAEAVASYFNAIQQSRRMYERQRILEEKKYAGDNTYNEFKDKIPGILRGMERTGDSTRQKHLLGILKIHQHLLREQPFPLSDPIEKSLLQLKATKTTYKNYIPKLVWYGTNNRYHQWLFGSKYSRGIIRGDFGISYVKKEPVIVIIKDKVIWSLFFSVLSIILAYLVSIPIGIRLAAKPHSRISKLTQFVLFLLYSIPSFFAGVLLLMLFANPDVISVFPPSGIKPIGGYDDDANLFDKLYASLPYIVLPLICYTYSSLAYISRLTQTSIMEQLPLDYIKTARAKGLTDKAIIRNHALKNSLLPLITVFSVVFPSIIGGSVIIESIFTIPGMGLETVKAIIAKDYPIVIAIITLSCLLTMLSYLIADLLYAWADPRIRYKT